MSELAQLLAGCEREPVHLSGAVQPHGTLLVLSEAEGRVVQLADNAAQVIAAGRGAALDDLVGKTLPEILGADAASRLAGLPLGREARHLKPIPVRIGGREMHATVHRSTGALVVELEPALDGGLDPSQLDEMARDAVYQLQQADTPEALWSAAARQVRALTGFDRVMVYRFHPDDHGEVVCEERRATDEPFLGLHYPASDIPEPARRLYQLNWLRLIPDVAYRPSPLVPAANPLTGAPLDLTHAVLRSVSPVHLEYLRNMGVRASMSVSLLGGEGLYGLIACHHYDGPHFVSCHARRLCEYLGQIVSLRLETIERGRRAHERLLSASRLKRLLERVARGEELTSALVDGPATLLDLVPADGAVVRFGGRTATIGRTPGAGELAGLWQWLRGESAAGIVHTDRLGERHPPARAFERTACGLLAVTLASQPGEEAWVVWLRGEQARQVSWGGDPSHAMESAADGHLGPRRSFAVWRETVRHQSIPWSASELEAAGELRVVIIDTVLHSLRELTRLNAELRDAVLGRDEFLSMASHELKTPLSTLQLQIESLVRLGERQPLIEAPRVSSHATVARRQLDRLVRLVDHLLDVSRLTAGRLRVHVEVAPVDLAAIAEEVVDRFRDAQGLIVRLHLASGVVGQWDRLRLDQVMTNLLSNAGKYGGGKPVEVEVRREGDRAVLSVSDRGPGITEPDRQRIFERFERAVTSLHSSGFGLGLWIVRKIVEAHGGQVRVDDRPGGGSIFKVELPMAAGAMRDGAA